MGVIRGASCATPPGPTQVPQGGCSQMEGPGPGPWTNCGPSSPLPEFLVQSWPPCPRPPPHTREPSPEMPGPSCSAGSPLLPWGHPSPGGDAGACLAVGKGHRGADKAGQTAITVASKCPASPSAGPPAPSGREPFWLTGSHPSVHLETEGAPTWAQGQGSPARKPHFPACRGC